MAESNAPESVAERTEGAAASSGFGVDARSIVETWGKILEEASAQPRAVLQAGSKLASDLGSIWLGESEIAPAPDDGRFDNNIWTENGLFRRVGQSYQAWSDSLDAWLEQSGLEGIERDRARFVMNAAKDIMAPVNSLLGSTTTAIRRSPTGMRSRSARTWPPRLARWCFATSCSSCFSINRSPRRLLPFRCCTSSAK
jgi:hypothetical protein